jgi:hypothetical protein
LAGATVSVVEAPEIATTVAADGTFSLQVPSGGECTFGVAQSNFHPTHTAVLPVGAAGLDHIGFQVPSEGTFTLFATLAGVTPDPEACQIVTTVSAAGGPVYGAPGVGEPDATVAISPSLPTRPIYFRYISASVIEPDPTLTATTIDGGVAFVNVPPGEYHLTANKPGVTFTPVKLRCQAGILVNAAPPWGLQAQ